MFSLPCFRMDGVEPEVPSTYVPPQRLGQFFLINKATKDKTLLQVEREMNPKHKHVGKEFLAIHPGMRWMRVGFYSQSKTECWVSLFQEYKGQQDPATAQQSTTHIETLVTAFTQCAKAENGGSWNGWELEPYVHVARAEKVEEPDMLSKAATKLKGLLSKR